jgi:hypothetical protein
LLDLAAEWPTFGYRRLTALLQRLGWPVNSKRVRRWMEELNLTGAPPRRTLRTTNSQHGFPRYPNLVKDLEITAPDQVWVADITYIRLRRDWLNAILTWHLRLEKAGLPSARRARSNTALWVRYREPPHSRHGVCLSSPGRASSFGRRTATRGPELCFERRPSRRRACKGKSWTSAARTARRTIRPEKYLLRPPWAELRNSTAC